MNILKKEYKQRSDESGMSLIEVMISTLILGVVLAAMGQALTLGIKMNSESKMRVSSLNTCKHITESMKTEISQSQGVFDGTPDSDITYFVDSEGTKTYSVNGSTTEESFTSESAFRVNVVVLNNDTLTQTVSGVTSVLVKELSVTVVEVQNIGQVGREASLNVEIIRPSA